MAYRNSRSDKGKWIPDPPREARRPPIKIPQVDTASLIEEHKLTLIGRVTNPKIQKTRALVDFFLQQWRVSGSITGRDLGPNLFQFKFESERDLQMILAKAPFHFKRWMIILQRWEPIISDFFPALIPFWITIHGIPLHYWTKTSLDTIGNELGPVDGYEVEKGRIRVLINGLKPLEMNLDISLPSGEIKQVELEYDNLEKHCFICYSLSHEKEDCPTQRAIANGRDSGSQRIGISQSRTLDRLDADRRKAFERKQARADSSQWQRPSSREVDWQSEKNFRFHYGARRDPNHNASSRRNGKTEEVSRRPARERLSLSKDDTSSGRNEVQSKVASQTPRTEWRPVGSGSRQRVNSKSAHSLVSHTPSPRPQREGDSNLQANLQAHRQNSGEGSIRSLERRSALARLSLPTERVPLLQDGVANVESGRLQEVDIQYLEETMPIGEGTNIPSTSRNHGQINGDNYDASQDRSPIRTLSEDRVHVSLRLGPLFDSEEEGSFNLQPAALSPQPLITTRSQTGKSKSPIPPGTKKRGPRSPVQGLTLKRRRVTKTQSSPRRKQTKSSGASGAGTSKAAGATQPRTTIIPATKKKGTDFRSAPKPLP